MATHVDRGHIHNHFVWCAANVITHKKYRSNKRTYHEIRDASDRLCKENNLSVIVPQGVGKSYTEYQAERTGTSWKEKLRTAIDNVVSESADFDDFLRRMELLGYEMKNGKYISFRAPEQERFTRAKTLGENYTEDSLKRRISEKSVPEQHTNAQPVQPISPPEKQKKLGQFIDIQEKRKQGMGKAFEHWAKLHNLKVNAATLIALQEAYSDYDSFEKQYIQVLHEKAESGSALNAVDNRIQELTALKKNIQIYHRTKNIHQQYRSAKNTKKFYQENESDLLSYRTAKKMLSAVQPVLSAKRIESEIAKLKASKPALRNQYKQRSDELKQMEPIRKNLYTILQQSQKMEQKKNELSV